MTVASANLNFLMMAGVLLDDTHAIMSQEAFDATHEGIPAGPNEVGMIWRSKRTIGFKEVDCLYEVVPPKNIGKGDGKNSVDWVVREILVVK